MSWVALGTAAVTTGGAWALNKYGGGGDSGGGQATGGFESYDLRNPDQKRIQGSLADLITRSLPNYNPGEEYKGQLTAGMSPFEEKGMGFLSQFLDNPGVTSGVTAANKNLTDTISGGFDPNTSDFYQTMKEAMELNRVDSSDRLDRELAGRNKYFSSERIGEQGDLERKSSSDLNTLLAQLAQTERDNQFKAIDRIGGISDMITQSPLKKASAATTIGALPRQLEQADFEAQYEKFLNERKEYSHMATLAAGAPSNMTQVGLLDRGVGAANQPSFLEGAGSKGLDLALEFLKSGGGGFTAGGGSFGGNGASGSW